MAQNENFASHLYSWLEALTQHQTAREWPLFLGRGASAKNRRAWRGGVCVRFGVRKVDYNGHKSKY